MSNLQRIGVYGGTFDPIHTTHLAIARAALAHAQLARVLFVVAASPPHKQNEVYAGAEDRCALVQAAIAGEPKFELSRIEIDRGGPSFTVDTLRQLHREHPGAELFLIIGQDSLVELPSWRDPRGILAQARLLVVPRPGAPAPPLRLLEGRFEMLSFAESSVSSTEVRARIAGGKNLNALLPPAVERLIRAKGLYHAASNPPPA